MADKQQSGLRFNQGKLRYDLLHPVSQEGIVKVLTKGSIKYAERNWEKGMSWTSVLASLKRHLASFEAGEDYDPETGELHVDHMQCNAHFLSAYYKIAPKFDDRVHTKKPKLKYALDIDEVLCDFIGGWHNLYGGQTPEAWGFDWQIVSRFTEMRKNNTLDSFYLGLKPKIKPSDIPFEPHCYVTSRPVDNEITKEWLRMYGFPLTKVITVPINTSKVQVLKDEGIDIFVDDRYENFLELNQNGICCYLLDAPHNQRYNVGYRRIKSLKELIW
jgi:hypothetical protein